MTVLVCGCLVALVSGCVTWFRPTSAVLYKPSCDLRPVLTLQLPEHISTLAALPRTETIVEDDGFNKLLGEKLSDPKESFYLRKGGDFKEGATEYRFVLFHSDAGAIEEYEYAGKHHPVFRETTDNGLTGRVHYTEEPRADPEGGLVPMGCYISRADFRLHNLYICVTAQDNEKPHNDKLANAVKELAQMLSGALASTNQTPK